MFSLMTPILVGTIVAIGYPVIRGYFKFSEVPGLIIDGAKSMVSVAVLLALGRSASARPWQTSDLPTTL